MDVIGYKANHLIDVKFDVWIFVLKLYQNKSVDFGLYDIFPYRIQ